jgi:hypothetical protein
VISTYIGNACAVSVSIKCYMHEMKNCALQDRIDANASKCAHLLYVRALQKFSEFRQFAGLDLLPSQVHSSAVHAYPAARAEPIFGVWGWI